MFSVMLRLLYVHEGNVWQINLQRQEKALNRGGAPAGDPQMCVGRYFILLVFHVYPVLYKTADDKFLL